MLSLEAFWVKIEVIEEFFEVGGNMVRCFYVGFWRRGGVERSGMQGKGAPYSSTVHVMEMIERGIPFCLIKVF
jgi:hypothetical protein